MTSQKERMLAGELYIANDPELAADLQRAASLMQMYNASDVSDALSRRAILLKLLDGIGEGSEIRPPLYIDYGQYIRIGSGTFINYGAMLLDCAPIVIGNDCQVGPNVQFLTPTHPIEPGPRREKWEAAKPITVGDNVWIGGGAILCPGVTIGDNTVVGAGAVVTRDLPANVVAVGNPAKVIREL